MENITGISKVPGIILRPYERDKTHCAENQVKWENDDACSRAKCL